MKKIFALLLACIFALSLISLSETAEEDKVLMNNFHLLTKVTLTDTSDFGYCIQHIYEGTNQDVEAAAKALKSALTEEFGMEQIFYCVFNPLQPDSRWYENVYLNVEHPEYQAFMMGGDGQAYKLNECHAVVRYAAAPEGEKALLTFIHSSTFYCHEEMLLQVQETQDNLAAQAITWRQMGTSGESFYYGQTDDNGVPSGFTVYESNQNCTYYGVNLGGRNMDKWDGTIIAVNRAGDTVDSVNLITYENGQALYSTRYFADGTITYCTFEQSLPSVRYDREGSTLTKQDFSRLFMDWRVKTNASFDEVLPEWGLGYQSFALEADEKVLCDRLHVGSYSLSGVTDAGENVEIMRLNTYANGSVEYVLNGESVSYDYAKNVFDPGI